jgi:hypothetical protein
LKEIISWDKNFQKNAFKSFNEYQLRRRHHNVDEEIVQECILTELDGSGSLLGYRSMWHILHSKYGVNVPRSVVQILLAELDPVGTQQKKAQSEKAAVFQPQSQLFWHSDGYDKLMPYGFPIHSCIDDYSRRITWLKLPKSNNNVYYCRILFRIY